MSNMSKTNLINLVEKMTKKMKWYDFPLLKLSVFFMTLFLITVWPGFRALVLSFKWHWYLIISIILMIPLLKKMFLK